MASKNKRRGAPDPFAGVWHALGNWPAGLVRVGAATDPETLATAARSLGRNIPEAYMAFLRAFDGADLFHGAVVLAGVGPDAPRSLGDLNAEAKATGLGENEFAFGESENGDVLFLGPDPVGDSNAGDMNVEIPGPGAMHVFRLHDGERAQSGSSFLQWLEATLASGRLLYDNDGEFLLDAFEVGGEELTPTFALRQAERALRKDPDSAEQHHNAGLALRRLGKAQRAIPSLAHAARLDPGNPWPWFDLGRAELACDHAAQAAAAFDAAARAVPGPPGARFCVHAARAAREAGLDARAEAALREAQARDPGITESIARSVAQATLDGDDDALEEARSLAAAFEPIVPANRRLRVIR